MNTTPWDIYAEQLFPVGYGHPLWHPEPQRRREANVGDVGWLKEGELRPLFNSMKPESDPVNPMGVPTDFTEFNPHNVSIGERNKITQHIVYSRSIHNMEAGAELAGGQGIAPVSAGAGFKFQSTTDSGAFVLLQAPACSKDIESKRHIINYMRDNFDRWLEFANNRYGLELKDQDLIFVCGTTKTSRWAVAAFQGPTYRKKEGHIHGDFGPLATAGLSISISNQQLPAQHWAHGPTQTLTMSPPAIDAQDQCLFLHYYKMKRRLWWKEPIKAAAGPHQLPPGPDTAGADASVAVNQYEFEPEGEPGRGEGYDPVNCLLDYILQQSDAEVAIASDLDLIAIFTDYEFPYDIVGGLLEVKPTIDVDERGVGTISIEYQLKRKRRSDDQIEEATKRARASHESASGPSAGIPSGPSQYPDVSSQWEGDPPPPNMMSHDALPPQYLGTQGEGEGEGGLQPDSPDVPMDRSSYAGAPHQPITEPGHERNNDPGDVPPAAGSSKRIADGGHEGSVTSLVYSPDGRYVASGSEDTSIIIWDTRHDMALRRLDESHQDTVSALAFSCDNRFLASASHDEDIIVWTVANGQHQRLNAGISIHSLVYTPDGSKLIAGASDGRLFIYRTETYGDLTILDKNKAVVSFIVFSPDGRLMATGGTETVCYVWETATLESGEPLSVLEGHRGMVCAAAFAPDNRRIITGSDDGSSWIWNAETGEALVNLHEHTGPVWAVAFSPDGKQIASGSSDSTVRVCDSFSGERVWSLDEHNSMINAVEFSPDGKYLASASSDNTVRLWDLREGACVTTYNEHNDNVTHLAFAPDGSTIASSSHDGKVHIRQLRIAEPLEG